MKAFRFRTLVCALTTFAFALVPAHLLASSPVSVAVNATTNMVYVGDGYGPIAYVSVIDGGTSTVVAQIPIPGGVAVGIAVNPSTNKIYVNGGANLFVIDGSTNAIVAEIPTGGSQGDIVVDVTKNLIYSACGGSCSSLLVIDGATNSIVRVVTLPKFVRNLALGFGGLYVSDGITSGILAVNTSDYSYTTLPSYDVPGALATWTQVVRLHFSLHVFASEWSTSDFIWDYNVTTSTGGTIIVPQKRAGRLGMNGKNNLLYVNIYNGDYTPGTVQVVNPLTYALVASIPIGVGPAGLAINSTTNRIYSVNNIDSTVSIIDGSNNTVISTVSVL
jgi:DNA-binding beta-propeller fold protein YncE